MNRYDIGYNEELNTYFSKQDMIDYHKYKASVKSDEGREWHLKMVEKIKDYEEDDYFEYELAYTED